MERKMKWIKIGDYVEALIHVITLGFGKSLSTYVAVHLLGFKSCGCCERREWLNRLTDKSYDGKCKGVKLF
jgi:hypothetical protein